MIHLDYFHPVTAEGWADAANNYHDAFPEWALPGSGERSMRIYPNYVYFYDALIYTRDGKYPQEYVDKVNARDSRRVFVIRFEKGWYGVRR